MYLLLQLKLLLLLFHTISCDATTNECDKVNDEDSMPYNWSTIVSIRYDCQNKTAPITHCCSGTILTESYILTAANCVDTLPRDVSSADVTIVAGIHRASESEKIIRKVDQIIIHPQWTNERRHDIALLHLSSTLDFMMYKYITRICRPTRFNSLISALPYPLSNTQLLTIEWHHVKRHFNASQSVPLRQIGMSVVDSTCHEAIYDVEHQFCARWDHDSTGLF